jgi:hypothetical protein
MARICWLLAPSSLSGLTGRVSRLSKGSRSGCWLSSSRLIQCTSCRSACRRRDHHHLQVLHLRVLLKEPAALRRQAVAEAWIRVHLDLQEHHGELRAAGFGAAGALPGPEDAIEAVAQLLEFKGFKLVEAVAGG